MITKFSGRQPSAGLLLTALVAAAPAFAGSLVINPGGGVATDGSDGLRIAVHEFCNRQSGSAGDQIYFAGKPNFYPSAYNAANEAAAGDVGGMLWRDTALGGKNLTSSTAVYMESFRDNCWDSVTLSDLTGTAVELAGDRTIEGRGTAKGSGGAVVTYVKEGFIVKRTISYTYPDNYYEDAYEFTVPATSVGVPVKFYYGGDYYPGDDDTGLSRYSTANGQEFYVGVLRSNIKAGIRQVSGEPDFDAYFVGRHYGFGGAEAVNKYISYGLNLPNYVESLENVDVGLGIQWNLGTTNGTAYTVNRRMIHFVDFIAKPTTTTLVPPASASAPGAPYTVSGTVTLATPVDVATLPGSVTVKEGTTGPSCTDNILPGNGLTGRYDFSCMITPNTIGPRTLTATYEDTDNSPDAFKTSSDTDTHTVAPAVTCVGFDTPVDRRPTVNQANAGRVIPLKWRCTKDGAPVTTAPTAFRVASTSCAVAPGSATALDAIEEYAPGSSGLINKGDGNWQFNWATPTSYANSCKAVTVDFDGAKIGADFMFKR